MSEVNPNVDLKAFERTAVQVQRPKRRMRVLLVPLLIALAAGVVFFDSLRELVSSAPVVHLLRPTPAGGAAQQAGRPLFQAAGWVEPDPAPILVTSLEPGVLMEVKVQQGDAVKTGDVVGKLADEEQRLGYVQAEAKQKTADAELVGKRAELVAAQETWDHALVLKEAFAVAQGELAAQEAEVDLDRASVEKARSMVETAEAELAVQEALLSTGATSPWNRDLARAALRQAHGELAAMQAEVQRASADVAKSKAKLARATKELELRTEDRLRLERAKVAVLEGEAKASDAQQGTELARLKFSRTLVRAPLDGIVLERRTGVGSVVGPEGGETPPVVTLYDPSQLRIRVDVPQDKVAGVQPQQKALILSEARRDKPYNGVVTRVVHTADINKVTLQVHVRVEDPDSLLRPEMLCQVRFLAGETPAAGGAISADVVSIPANLVQGGSVWVFDPLTETARRKSVQAQAQGDGIALVSSGLNVTDKLIASVEGASMDILEDGLRVRPMEH
ncbi:MAG: HlyD family efflux transporter periplasmic adaptor subunit [Planctomycetes bacterium]|nr:HlyD family efflux transporter periplasmic adaptor subunit [Planctomycetota bacterium]